MFLILAGDRRIDCRIRGFKGRPSPQAGANQNKIEQFCLLAVVFAGGGAMQSRKQQLEQSRRLLEEVGDATTKAKLQELSEELEKERMRNEKLS
ncbi:hypothetical protein [Bradyrhizobium sp. JYMT SZCCT0428]|uniref:hypothetical protein n=1 Tax=Bradyrhizobium sp. JYMT SZCCT0428 TaxID=2807673 RepID=UPI001BA67429|nr:hypothetical protein [Bradyrhizobium sp. JYMT SZCCT0428]MBR1156877.1 hypothetical protein [Bradyrhizobium sp. JYMT SZCCT0428]